MNQILTTEINKGKSKNKDIKSIIKTFAIIMIVFGVVITSNASYTLYKNGVQVSMENQEKPVISVEKVDDEHISISASHNKKISSIVYQWNDEEEITIEGNEETVLTEKIKLPKGTNTIKITATANNGQSITYEKQYIAGSIPEIKLGVEGTALKATITSEEGLSYVTYRWDDDEEKREDLDEEKGAEFLIDIPQGLHTLTIIAVDINNNTGTKKQQVKGVTKPTLEVSTDGESFIVKATDVNELSKLEYNLNGEEKSIEINGKEYEYKIPLVQGENKLIITAYNSNDLSVQKKVKAIK